MTISRLFALVFGVVYVLTGLLGFVRPLTDAPHDGLLIAKTAFLLGIFAINWLHNLAHLLIGSAALAASSARTGTARLAVRAIGIAEALLFVVGLFTSDFLGTLPLNGADNILHLASAILALIIGFTDVGLRQIGTQRPAAA